ncbi:MAG: leucine--tRNA ligase [Dehalococcoidia bacterium]|nr:leucine--tRNA ligase [Dehalococcoidia bacterium]
MLKEEHNTYIPNEVESKWQSIWKETDIYKTSDNVSSKKNWYALSMFPYPSGDLHIGHWFAFTPADAHARFQRLEGYNVLHPQGFDAFGLPAENAAIKRNINPKKWTFDNINNMQKQFDIMGNSYDWNRKLITCTPEYYKWNQKFFIEMYKKGLAYRKNGPVWWDPIDQTTLANEQVVDGKSERSGADVIKKMMPQWYFKITDYAEELLDMSTLECPEKIKQMQRNWIGKSEGVTLDFKIENHTKNISTFTTRIDTIYGVTFVVLAPEHPIVTRLSLDKNKDVKNYILNSQKLSEIDRTSTTREKTGVQTDINCINPVTNEKIPVFIGDYVLASYGTGAVMGVPAHDDRDYIFAKKYSLPIKVVVSPDGSSDLELDHAFTGNGTQVNSAEFNGLSNIEAKQKISDLIQNRNLGKKTITYHLRDWLISRQRYWGTPIPMFYDKNNNIIPVEEHELPVILPDAKEFKPTGQSPLTLDEKFLYYNHPKLGKLKRETDTMDTFMDSSWYHLKFASPGNLEVPFEKEKIDKWSPVDQYMGGAEHAVMHLLYARFFNKVLRDLGYVNFDEPYKRLFNQGVMLARHMKISKRNNPLNPQPLVEKYGTDSVRAYLMFLGPWDRGGDWSDSGINGIYRWLNRIWEMMTTKYHEKEVLDLDSKNLSQISNQTTKDILNGMRNFRFNTSIATLMEYSNNLSKIKKNGTVSNSDWLDACKRLLIHLSPICPHISEEIWNIMGNKNSIHLQSNPSYNEELLEKSTYILIIQVNGKLRDQVELEKNTSKEEIKKFLNNSEKIKKHIAGKKIVKEIYIENKLMNLVVK